MKATIPETLIPTNAVKLGRLVTNRKSPAEEFYDSSFLPDIISEDNIITTSRNNFQEVLRSTLGTSTYSNLTAIIGSNYNLKTQEYVLLENPGLRKWLLRMIGKRRNNIYMIVGLRTITNANISCGSFKLKDTGGEISAPISIALPAALGVPIPIISDVLDVGVGKSRIEEHEVQTRFQTPGEMIYAVEYRKLEFSWFSSRKVDKATLGNSRWMFNTGLRRLEEENDVVNVHLAGEEAVEKGGGHYVEEFEN
ncbi:hypothetical protein TWF102_004638 [Orbilia oligospora]|uniref:Uncharacterized protein n=1 Tax=Orbilia oligospora TaxID=2813651 RepID=A0A7C8NEL7_ORBOL|nr:hypothetical protein TWF102_004638 [Orbilia oligospora]KAF3083757.1 hypothetical protein TWF706_001107 [Orbilia oligospora]KAF3095340.1 hypothetical protein TWF103_010310 [Orbilia oligospora]